MDIPWVIEEHTKIKHDLLRQYIPTWMNICFRQQKLLGFQQLVVYFDGFSGPGEYYLDNNKNSKCDGSPVIVAKIANDIIPQGVGRKVHMSCIDKDKVCVEYLNKILNPLNIMKQSWNVYAGNFEEQINAILDDIDKNKIRDYPLFFFIDPFGYSGFSMNTIKRILSYKMSEVFVNFMVYDIVRFWEEERKENAMIALFGSDEYKEADKASNSEERQQFFMNLYCKNLNSISLAEYVMPFRVNTPQQGTRPRYYLIHASHNIKALKEMKNRMASISASEYKFEAIGVVKGQMSMFDCPEKIDMKKRLIDYIKEQKTIGFEALEDWGYANTCGVSKTIKEALVQFEQRNDIVIQRKPRQKKNTVTIGAIIQSN